MVAKRKLCMVLARAARTCLGAVGRVSIDAEVGRQVEAALRNTGSG